MNTTRTPLFLMANLGAEVSRLMSSREKGDAALTESSLSRSLGIIAEIKKFPEMQSRMPEIDTLSSVIIEPAAIPPQQLKGYFEPFALRLMAV